jgi:hypothetical protein
LIFSILIHYQNTGLKIQLLLAFSFNRLSESNEIQCSKLTTESSQANPNKRQILLLTHHNKFTTAANLPVFIMVYSSCQFWEEYFFLPTTYDIYQFNPLQIVLMFQFDRILIFIFYFFFGHLAITYSTVAFYARMHSWTPYIIQDKFWNSYMIFHEFIGICFISIFAHKWDFINIFLYHTVLNLNNSDAHKVWLHCIHLWVLDQSCVLWWISKLIRITFF